MARRGAAGLGVGLAALALGAASVRAQEPSPVIADSIIVVGASRNAPGAILAETGLRPRVPITYRDVQRALRALFATGQYDDVRIERENGAAGEEILLIAVRERPIVVRTTVRGVVKVSERGVREKIELAPNRPLDPALLARSRQRIDSLYESEGYYLAEIRPRIVPQDSGRVLVVFEIAEGRRVAIGSVVIEGNRALSDRAIVKRMKTRPEGFWWFRRGEYAEDRLREDLERRLPEFFASRGYVDFRVVHDTLIVNPNNGKATLRVDVEEGPLYEVGTLSVEGNRRFSTDEILALNPFDSPERGVLAVLGGRDVSAPVHFDDSRWQAATQKLRTMYFNQGYIYAQIEPRMERASGPDSASGEEGAGAPMRRVNLSWVIQEGQPAVVNRVEIVGNEVTHERVIREAIVLLPGDVFNQDRLIRSYQNISNLGFFQQPLPPPDTRRVNDEGDIDVIFQIQERRTGNVNFGASVGQGTGAGGFLGLDEPNLFGQGKRGRLQWQFGRNINQFELSYSDPALRGSRISGTVSVLDTRVRYTIADLGQIRTRGGSLQFGIPLPRSRFSRVFVSYDLEFESFSGASRDLLGTLRCASCMRSTLGLTFLRDTRVDLPFPTGGALHRTSAQLTGGALGGSAAFQRYDLEGRWYAPAGQLGGTAAGFGGVRLVLGLTAKSGFVFGNPGPFFRQLFAMGGTQYGIPLRGYDEFAITPQGVDPRASLGGVPQSAFGRSYFAATAEFGARFSQAMYASLFYDVGNVWATGAGFNPTRLFRGAGVGVAVITPLGPLGLDYAYGFDRVDLRGRPAPGWKLHFRIGTFF